METVILWMGFIGAWLLFAGPIYQAALELRDEDIEIDRLHAARSKIQAPARTPVWWWLLPPVKIYAEFKGKREYQYRYMKALTREDIESLVSFRSKASAWLFVALGGFCIACKESYELAHHQAWSTRILIVIVVAMLILSILNLVVRIKNAEAIVGS